MSILEIHNVSKVYKARTMGSSYKLMAVNDVSFKIESGRCIGLVGESGCGKSTLGRLIVGLEQPSSGEIIFNNQKINSGKKMSCRKKLNFSKEVQMVFQDSYDAVNNRYTASKIIAEPLKNFYSMSTKEMDNKIDQLLSQVGLSSEEKEKYPKQFSGGQLQRICIARALATEPKLIVLDEPLSSLDVSVQAQILNLLSDLKEQLNLSYILISHDLEAVYYLSDEIVVMYGGRIMEHICDISNFYNMKHPYTMKLFSSTSVFDDKYSNLSDEDVAENLSIDVGVQKADYKGCPYAGRCVMVKEKCYNECPQIKEISEGHFVNCHFID